jgi:hypothetical protein
MSTLKSTAWGLKRRHRPPDSETIDSEIDAFNDLIATLAAGNGWGASSSNRNQDLLEAVEADRAIVRVLFLSFGLASPTKS